MFRNIFNLLVIIMTLPIIIIIGGSQPIYSSSASPNEAITCTKLLVSLPQPLQLIPKSCPTLGCTNVTSTRKQFVGATVVITIYCSIGHENTWCSAQHVDQAGTVVFYNNMICTASCLFSGNAHAKIAQMMSFMGMNWISNATFYRIQAAYLVPADHQAEVLSQHQGREQIVYEMVDVIGLDRQQNSRLTWSWRTAAMSSSVPLL